MDPTQQDVHDVLGVLYKSLTDAYWVTSTITDKDRIRGAADAVYDILTALNQVDIKSRTHEYTALKTKAYATIKKLKNLEDDIDSIIHVVDVAASVTQAISKALDFGAKFFV